MNLGLWGRSRQPSSRGHLVVVPQAHDYLLDMTSSRVLCATLALPVAAALACGGAASTPAPAPSPAPIPVAGARTPSRPTVAPPLPPVPEVDGPLAVNVVYPRPNQVITSRDSNFVFGSIGSGRATLTVNGFPARVYPNGAFMVYVANPAATAPRYDFV